MSNTLLAVYGVQAGDSGKSYKITAKVIASDGSQFEEDIRMRVADE